ncbi:MAG: hypothetical protein GTN82_27345 [Candidatus Aminicenantes bacterium]|nr:hypothetical protein [Candidatus Aminicenantes bacterium]
MSEKKNAKIKDAIKDCVEKVSPIFDLYACITHCLESEKMLETLDIACKAMTDLFAKVTPPDKDKTKDKVCPTWQVMSACEEFYRKEDSKAKPDKG